MSDPEELRVELERIAEQLGELALVRLRDAVDAAREETGPAAGAGGAREAAIAEERLLTRARRSVDKAAQLLAELPGD